jgi:transcription elongation factor Elf1
VAAKKKKKNSPESSPPRIKRAFKPERCSSHKFIMEADGRVDMTASHEVTDDSICFNCGLYFSTWVWYSDKVNAIYWNGVDSEAGQTLNFVSKELDTITDKYALGLVNTILDKLRERRKTLGRRF